MAFGSELRRQRLAAGLSLTELAARIHYSEGYLVKVETGAASPNVAFAELCDAALSAEVSLAALLPSDVSRPRAPAPVLPRLRMDLPPSAPWFRDRVREVEDVRAALMRDDAGSAAVCAISGLPGVGKTALVLRCAHRLRSRFADGCLFLDLRSHTPGTHAIDPAAALDRFLRLLGVSPDEIPDDLDDRAGVFRYRLRGRSVLIVLDNAANAAQVRPLIPAEPNCRVLVTSRDRLGALDDARHVPLRALPRKEAAELLCSLTEPRREGGEAAYRIAEHCGGLPLALRIAAARLRDNAAWGLAGLEDRLADEAGRLRGLDDDERCVGVAFNLSYRQLSAAQRRLFGLVVLHPATEFELTAVAALAGATPHDTERELDGLCEANLLEERVRGRYRIHDLLKAFARETALVAVSEDEQRAALGRLLEAELSAVAAVDLFLAPHRYRPALALSAASPAGERFGDEAEALHWIIQEAETLAALVGLALDHGFHEQCWQLAYLLRSFYFLDKRWDSWISTHRLAVSAARDGRNAWAEAVTHNNLGVALIDRGDRDQAATHFRTALDIFRDLDDGHGTATTRAHLAWVSHHRGHHHTALNDFSAALTFYRGHGSRRNEAITLRGISLVETALQRYADASDHALAAIELFDELSLELDAAMAVNTLAWAGYRAGRHQAAAHHYSEAFSRAQRCGSSYEASRAVTGLGNVHAALGERAAAEREWRRARRLHPRLVSSDVDEIRVRDEFLHGEGHAEGGRPSAADER